MNTSRKTYLKSVFKWSLQSIGGLLNRLKLLVYTGLFPWIKLGYYKENNYTNSFGNLLAGSIPLLCQRVVKCKNMSNLQFCINTIVGAVAKYTSLHFTKIYILSILHRWEKGVSQDKWVVQVHGKRQRYWQGIQF